ncbi:MAG: D-aminoacylase [Deltaproteobacteria bacterium]|nr:D-aminoacylase [Deltaproteobacteria bacterium]
MKLKIEFAYQWAWLLAFLLTPELLLAQDSHVLIRNAQVIDGTGAPSFIGSVRIRLGVITAMGELAPMSGETIIDGTGQALAPGFIDTHSHYDEDPGSTKLAAVSQGITTLVVGQDGSSNFPLADFYKGIRAAPIATNLASYVGHGTLRQEVMGEDFRRPATDAEIGKMRELLRKELESGALGLSTGLEYDPGIYSTTEEVIALAKETQTVGGRYISHIRSEDRHLEDAVEEIIRIGKEAALPVQISHMKLARRSLWGKADQILARLDRARADGVDITADIYPYEYWQSTMTVLLPERDFTNRESVSYALTELVAPGEMILARYDAEESYEGKTLEEVAKMRGEDAVTAFIELIALSQEEDAAESVVARSMTEVDIQRILRWPHSNVSSDGSGSSGHPRGHGSFPRVLRQFVVEGGGLPLEEAIHKMTGLSAEHVGLEKRGTLRIGGAADLVLFRPEKVKDRATLRKPHELSEGISRVWVNGIAVYENGQATGELPGKILKR